MTEAGITRSVSWTLTLTWGSAVKNLGAGSCGTGSCSVIGMAFPFLSASRFCFVAPFAALLLLACVSPASSTAYNMRFHPSVSPLAQNTSMKRNRCCHSPVILKIKKSWLDISRLDVGPRKLYGGGGWSCVCTMSENPSSQRPEDMRGQGRHLTPSMSL